MRHPALALLALALAGCTAPWSGATVRPTETNQFTIEHGSWRFQRAAAEAEGRCQERGLHARHLGTDGGPFGSLSRFECVPK